LTLDLSEAQSMPGVVRIFTYKDIPGINQIGGIVPDEPLLAEDHVHFNGMPVALVVAESVEIAQAALKKIKIEIDPLPIITDPREAREKGELIVPPRTFKIGDTTAAWNDCEFIFEGIAETNGQEHLYIETQGAYTLPIENDCIKVYSSTQGPNAVQRHMADVLAIPMHRLEIDVTRLAVALAAKKTRQLFGRSLFFSDLSS
jgi:xanthine dehydrogenase large subunit